MNTRRTGQGLVHRRHLSLVAPVAPEIRLSRREVRTMLRVAFCYVGGPLACQRISLLRAELMEAAEYYATGADEAAMGRSPHAA
jgi:hypothetical protein